MSNGGPKAPKDPTKKRPSVFVLYDKTIEAYGKPEGGSMNPLFLDNERLSNYAKTIGRVEDAEMLALLNSAEGFRKLVHSVGVSIACENTTQEAEFVLHMYGKSDVYQSGTKHATKIVTNGSEVEIPLSEIDWYGDDVCVGQFLFQFESNWEVATVNVRLYLNDGYTAPEFVPDAPVDFESAAYKEMIAKSFVSLGNNVRLKRAIEKAKAGEDVTVAFIGGSITEGAGATPSQKTCYSKVAYDRFCARFGNGDNVHYTKVGVGGTSSELGMIRYERDILGRGEKPDVVIVEYAVNDAGDETDGVCFESLVRMAMDGPGNPAVILLFAVFMDDFNLQERMIPVGIRCKSPMISLKNAVTPQFSEETPVITKRQYFYDLFHPSNDGHRIMTDCIDYFWEQAEAAPEQTEDAEVDGTPAIGEKYRSLRAFDRATYKNHEAVKSLREGVFSEKDTMLQYVEKDDNPKAEAEFPDNWMKPSGSTGEPFRMCLTCKDLLLVYKDSGNPMFGKAEVRIDGKVTRTVDPLEIGWDHCTAYVVLESDEAAEHEVEISMKEEDAEKSFTILGFGYTL